MSVTTTLTHSGLEVAVKQVLAPLMAMDTTPDGRSHAATAAWIGSHLTSLGFAVEITPESKTPLIIARRAATPGAQGHVFVFGHYDVDHIEPGWLTDPLTLTEIDRRWYGLGVADNKGALAARLVAIQHAHEAPAVTWVLQGEEESGSGVLRQWIRERGLPRADWYLEENGWARPDGSQRVLACEVGEGVSRPIDATLQTRLLASLESGWDRREVEVRFMNKHFVPGGCAFQSAVPPGGRYLAIGTNDALTRIHAPNESIPVDGTTRHALGFIGFLEAVARGALLP